MPITHSLASDDEAVDELVVSHCRSLGDCWNIIDEGHEIHSHCDGTLYTPAL